MLLRILSTLVLLAPVLAAQSGVTEMGEGGELIVSEGTVIREVPAESPELMPLLAVGSAGGNHHLYDPNGMFMVGVWSGRFGRVNEAGAFEVDPVGMRSFSLEKTPWSFGEKPRVICVHEWIGCEVRDEHAVFQYRLLDEESGTTWEIEESLVFASEDEQEIHFDISPSGTAEKYLNYWLRQTDFRRVVSDGQPNQRNKLKNLFPNQEKFTLTFVRRKATPTVPHGYSIESIPVPVPTLPARFEPTDFDFAPDGSVFASTRTGGVWRLKDGEWSLFADGLHEINGIRVDPEGQGVFVMQRPELTLLSDTDGDGTADFYKSVEDRFRFGGNYHEFAYGPRGDASIGRVAFERSLRGSLGWSRRPAPPGVDQRARRVEIEIDAVSLFVISREVLKQNKEASGRLQDLADLDRLN